MKKTLSATESLYVLLNGHSDLLFFEGTTFVVGCQFAHVVTGLHTRNPSTLSSPPQPSSFPVSLVPQASQIHALNGPNNQHLGLFRSLQDLQYRCHIQHSHTLTAANLTPEKTPPEKPAEQPAEQPVKQHDPKQLMPMTEKGHRGGIIGMQSDARGMKGGLAPGTINGPPAGGKSHFGLEKKGGA